VSGYLIRRFFLMLVTLFGISVVIFVMLRLVPGNITDIIFDSAGFVNPKQKQRIERELGLDQPIVTQYARWIGGLARGDLGYAYVSEKPGDQGDRAAHPGERQARGAGARLLDALRRDARAC
jgi:peptide/nickel transport system permease protein